MKHEIPKIFPSIGNNNDLKDDDLRTQINHMKNQLTENYLKKQPLATSQE
jgi:hypothetical protein